MHGIRWCRCHGAYYVKTWNPWIKFKCGHGVGIRRLHSRLSEGWVSTKMLSFVHIPMGTDYLWVVSTLFPFEIHMPKTSYCLQNTNSANESKMCWLSATTQKCGYGHSGGNAFIVILTKLVVPPTKYQALSWVIDLAALCRLLTVFYGDYLTNAWEFTRSNL